jgi:hypothetical protein
MMFLEARLGSSLTAASDRSKTIKLHVNACIYASDVGYTKGLLLQNG